jgi:hypothetical protein
MLENIRPHQRAFEETSSRSGRVEQIAVTGACSSEIGGNPGVFQLNDEGTHNACFHV